MMSKHSKSKLLLIDDEPTIVEMLQPYLSDNGYHVTSYTDPAQALLDTETNHYDIILTDLKMPKISGIEVAKQVKQRGTDAKIIFMTGYASVDSAIDGIHLGVYDYIKKPFKIDQINLVIDRARDQLHLERENHALNKQIQKMLSDMTMLYDIVTILNQVSDFQIAVEMVLDTITEGMNIENAALFLDNNQTNNYSVFLTRGFEKIEVDNVKLSPNIELNGQPLSFDDFTILKNCKSKINFSGKDYDLPKGTSQCVFLPIIHQSRTIAFLGLFQPKNKILNDDEMKLMSILTTQIAPIFGCFNSSVDHYVNGGMNSYQMIKSKIFEAESVNSSASFALMKIKSLKEINYNDISDKLDMLIREETFGLSAKIWKGIDHWLVGVVNLDPVSLEIWCTEVRHKFEELNINGDKGVLSVQHVIASYPKDGKTAEELHNFIAEQLFITENNLNG